jgi:hypothetical protein
MQPLRWRVARWMVTACDGGRYRMRSDLRRMLIADGCADAAGYRARTRVCSAPGTASVGDLVARRAAYHHWADDRQGLRPRQRL